MNNQMPHGLVETLQLTITLRVYVNSLGVEDIACLDFSNGKLEEIKGTKEIEKRLHELKHMGFVNVSNW
jgi:hypothetical protein